MTVMADDDYRMVAQCDLTRQNDMTEFFTTQKGHASHGE